jgi:predicted enzyme related to lactoylglutathione lyase
MDVGPLPQALVVDPRRVVRPLAGRHDDRGRPGERARRLTWADLRSTDPSAAQAFYSAVFGFHVDPLAMAGPDYGTFRLRHEQAPLGGMGGMMGSPEGTPSHWLVYVAVADTDAALAAAEQAGGAVVMPAKDTAFGRIGGVRDPYGAELVLIAVPPGAPVPDRAG